MAYGRPVWGIDVGQRALKAIRLRWGPDGPQVLKLDIIEHPKILSQPDADEDQLIRDSLEKFVSRNDTTGDRVVISVPGQSAFARFIKLPPVEKKKVPEIVRYEARQQIPFAIEDVLWDYQPIGDEQTGLETEIGLFAIKKDLINDFISNFVMAKVEVDAVQIAPLALYNFLVADNQVGEGATVLLDMGAENSNLLISDGSRIWLRNIPLGGNNFTRAISKARKLTFAAAEIEKRDLRKSKDARQIFEAVQPVFAELLAEIQRSMGYFTSLHRDVRIERVLGMGNAFRMPGLRRYLAQNLQYRVDEFDGFKSTAESEALQTPEAREHLLALPVAYGLAVQGLEVAPLRTNLLPPEIVRTRIIRKKRPAAALCVGVLAAAVGVSFLGAVIQRGSAVDQTLQTKGQSLIAECSKLETDYNKAARTVEAEIGKTKPFQETLDGRGFWPCVYTELIDCLPNLPKEDESETFDRWVRLESFEPQGEVIKPEEFSTKVQDASLVGLRCRPIRMRCFTRVPHREAPAFLKEQLLKRINDHPLFGEARFDQIQPRFGTVPRIKGTEDNPGETETFSVREWYADVALLCVISRVRRQLAGKDPIDPDYKAPAPPKRQPQKPSRTPLRRTSGRPRRTRPNGSSGRPR